MKLKLPTALVIATISLAGCNDPSQPQQNNQSLCPAEYFCSSDAARAFNCTDLSPDPFQSDLGTCFPPV
jgi:hypothetical protein